MRIPVGRRLRADHRDAGATLLEVVVTLALAGILMAIATWGMRSYLVANRHTNTANDIRSALRQAGERSLSEGRTYCVYFTSTNWAIYRSDCSVAANKVEGPNSVDDASITLTNVTFTPPVAPVPNQNTGCTVVGKCAYFYPRGTALAGQLQVTRGSKSYTIKVEGLTGRVSLV